MLIYLDIVLKVLSGVFYSLPIDFSINNGQTYFSIKHGKHARETNSLGKIIHRVARDCFNGFRFIDLYNMTVDSIEYIT